MASPILVKVINTSYTLHTSVHVILNVVVRFLFSFSLIHDSLETNAYFSCFFTTACVLLVRLYISQYKGTLILIFNICVAIWLPNFCPHRVQYKTFGVLIMDYVLTRVHGTVWDSYTGSRHKIISVSFTESAPGVCQDFCANHRTSHEVHRPPRPFVEEIRISYVASCTKYTIKINFQSCFNKASDLTIKINQISKLRRKKKSIYIAEESKSKDKNAKIDKFEFVFMMFQDHNYNSQILLKTTLFPSIYSCLNPHIVYLFLDFKLHGIHCNGTLIRLSGGSRSVIRRLHNAIRNVACHCNFNQTKARLKSPPHPWLRAFLVGAIKSVYNEKWIYM